MSKNNIKKMFDEKINKEDIKKKILENNNNFNFFNIMIPTICLVILIVFIIFNISFNNSNEYLNNTNNDFANNNVNNSNNSLTTSQYSANSSININEIKDNENITSNRYDAKIVNNVFIPFFEELTNLNIPKDLDNQQINAAFVKGNNKNYDVLNNYIFNYINTSNDRKIIISLSKEYKPLRDYYFDKNDAEVSIINDIELKIFKYKNIYFTEFNFNDINFDIETNDISYEEFISLLKSLIK